MRRTTAFWLIALLAATAAAAEPLHLSAEAMRRLAFETMKAGHPEKALEFADALLQRDQADPTALMVRSQALRALGRASEAENTARQAWRQAETPQARFGAAMALAQALSTQGRRGAAQWWLRHAAEDAPSPRAYAMARRDFGYVKSRNPLTLRLDLSLAPSSNVNSGSRQDKMTLAGIPFELDIPAEAQALSGLGFGLGLSGTYRLATARPDRKTDLRLGLLGQSVSLSADARAAAPAARAGDYGYVAAEAGLQHRRPLDAEGQNSLELAGTVGHNWHGGRDLSDYLRLHFGLDHRLNERASLSFGVTADHIARIDSQRQSSDRLALSLGYGRKLGQDRISLELEAADSQSQSPETSSAGLSLDLQWQKARPIAGVSLAAGIGLESRDFPGSRYVTGGRSDLRLQANLSMTFENVTYMGFAPVLNLQAERNNSNAALFDSENLGITLGITSSF